MLAAAHIVVCVLVFQPAGICGQSTGEEGAIQRKNSRSLRGGALSLL
jgi:hypothetical protein